MLLATYKALLSSFYLSLNRINPFLCYKRGRHCCRGTKNRQQSNLATYQMALSAIVSTELLNLRSCFAADMTLCKSHGGLIKLYLFRKMIYNYLTEI